MITTTHERARELWSRCLTGDREAFEGLVGPFVEPALGLARRLLGNADDAEDVVQDALLKTYGSLATLKDPAGIRSWFLSIVWRQGLDALRRRKLRSRHEQAQAWPARPASEPADELSARRELLARVHGVLEELPPKQRAVLHLRVYEGLEYAEIARIVGITPGSARVYLVKARHHLRERLGAELSS